MPAVFAVLHQCIQKTLWCNLYKGTPDCVDVVTNTTLVYCLYQDGWRCVS